MNIKGISDNLGSDPVGRANNSQKPKPQAPLTVDVPSNDQVDMSKLSTLMARSAKDLEQHLVVRQDKVDQFRDDLNTPPNLSDEVIDTIWRRMLGH
jgi:hypothetical protein